MTQLYFSYGRALNRETCTTVFSLLLYSQQSQCSLVDEQMMKIWFTMEFYSAVKKNEIMNQHPLLQPQQQRSQFQHAGWHRQSSVHLDGSSLSNTYKSCNVREFLPQNEFPVSYCPLCIHHSHSLMPSHNQFTAVAGTIFTTSHPLHCCINYFFNSVIKQDHQVNL